MERTHSASGPDFRATAAGSLLSFVTMAKSGVGRGLGWLAAGLVFLVSGWILSCTSSEKDKVVLEFNLDSTKLGKSDSLRFEIYNGKAPGPGEQVEPVQVITVIVQEGTQKVKITLSDKVQSDFSVVVIGFDSTGEARRKLFEFDDFNPDKDTPPAVLLAVITAANLDMRPGETRAPGVDLKPSDAADRRVVFTSSDSTVAAIVGSNRDSVKALKDGQADITVSAVVGGAKGRFRVTVNSSVRLRGVSAQPLAGLVGDTLAPDLDFDPSDATNTAYSLRSLDTGIVQVVGTRVVGRAAGSGKVEITVADGGHKDTFNVAIANPVIRLTAIGSKPLSGLIGDTLAPELTFEPDEAGDKTFGLRSLDPTVADIVGLQVVGRSEGRAKVEVTATDGGLKDTFEVTVSRVPIKVKGVQGSNLRGLPGDTLAVDLVWDPVDATEKAFSLKSLDTAVARVLDSRILGVKLGTARVEVASGDGGHKDTFEVEVARVAFDPDVLPITTLKCAPCHIPGQVFNFQDSLVLIRKGASALDRLQRNPDAPGKMPLKGSANGDLSPRQLGVLLDWLNQNVIPLTGMTARDMTLNFGDTAAPELAFVPANASNQVVSLTSLDSATVAVTADGRLLPLKTGTATVLAQSDDGGIRAQFKITVDPPSWEKNVLPITTLKCAPCHVPGQTFNFQDSLVLIFEGANAMERLQRDSLAAGKMPLRGSPAGDLSPSQKEIILAWLRTKVVPLKGITVADDSVLVGQSKAPVISFDPPNANNRTYVLETDDTALVEIDGVQYVGKATGTAGVRVRALDGGHVKTMQVKVKPVPVDSVAGVDTSGTIGDTVVPRVLIFPANAAVKTYGLSLPRASTVLQVIPARLAVVGISQGKDTVIITSTDGAKVGRLVFTVGPVLPRGLTAVDTNVVLLASAVPRLVWNPTNTSNKAFTLSIAPADTGIAALRTGNSILGKTLGSVVVTAQSVADTSLRDDFRFTVGPVPVVSISARAHPLMVHNTTISARSFITFNPTNATNKGFSLVSSAPTFLQVVNDTTIRALRLGATPVTVTSTDGAKQAPWNVTVIRTPFTGAVKNTIVLKCGACHFPGSVYPNWQDSTLAVGSSDRIVARINQPLSTRMPPSTQPQLTTTPDGGELKILTDYFSVP